MRSIYKQWKNDGKLEEILTLVKKWRSLGAELEEIAKKLGINVSTLYVYQNKYEEFGEALKRGKEILDAEVESSLRKECVGYYYEETTTTTQAVIDKATGQITTMERVEKRTIRKYARPSITAIVYYLNNREPDLWRNRVLVEGENENGILPQIISAMKEIDQKEGNDDD